MADNEDNQTDLTLNYQKIPVTSSNVIVDKNTWIMIAQFVWGLFITILASLWYYKRLATYQYWYDIFLLPLNIYGNIWLFTFSVAVFAWAAMKILLKIHPIKEGIFDLGTAEGQEEYKFYRLRFWFAYFALWLARAVPLPWSDFIVWRMMGSKMGKNVCLYDSWMDIELIDIGDFVMTSINTSILSHAIYDNKFIQMKTVVKKNAITGAQSIIAPGTVVEEGAVLGAAASTYVGQRLEGNLIHVGTPVSKHFPISNDAETQDEDSTDEMEGQR